MGREAFETAGGNPRYERIAERLAHLLGQDDAIKAIKLNLETAFAGQSAFAFLFTGPGGVGKTEAAKEIAEGSNTGVINLQMCDYSQDGDHYRLIGSPPDEGSVGTLMAVLDKIRAHPRSVLLLDEIEKAHPKALSIVNDILLTRSTTLSNGHDLDFESAMVVITAGVDRDTLKKMLAKAGLHSRKLPKGQSIEDALETALPKAIVFKPISEDTLKDHIRQRIADISKRIRAERGVTLDISEAAVKDMATRLEPEVAKLGLRPVRALIDREVVSPLVKIILRSNIPLAATVDMRNGSLEVSAKSIAPANGPAINPR